MSPLPSLTENEKNEKNPFWSRKMNIQYTHYSQQGKCPRDASKEGSMTAQAKCRAWLLHPHVLHAILQCMHMMYACHPLTELTNYEMLPNVVVKDPLLFWGALGHLLHTFGKY